MNTNQNADNLPFAMSLQLFAEPEPGAEPTAASTEPSPVVEQPQAQPAAPAAQEPEQLTGDPREKMNLLEFWASRKQASEPVTLPTTEPAPSAMPGGQPAANEPVPEPRVEIPDKFKNLDGSLNAEALIKSYTNMEQMYGRIQQDPQSVDNLAETNRNLQALVETLKAAAAPPAPSTPQLSPEEIATQEEAENERLWEMMQNNPKAFKENLRNEMRGELREELLQELQPVIHAQQKEAMKTEIEGFIKPLAEKAPDFANFVPGIKEELTRMGDAGYESLKKEGVNPVEFAYNLTKVKQAGNQPPPSPPKTVEDFLNDPETFAKIAQDPKVQEAILKQNARNVADNQPPTVIGSHVGGQVPAAAPTEIKSTRDGTKAFLSFLRQGGKM